MRERGILKLADTKRNFCKCGGTLFPLHVFFQTLIVSVLLLQVLV